MTAVRRLIDRGESYGTTATAEARFVHAVYSTGPIGRFVATDVLRAIEFQQKAAAAPKS